MVACRLHNILTGVLVVVMQVNRAQADVRHPLHMQHELGGIFAWDHVLVNRHAGQEVSEEDFANCSSLQAGLVPGSYVGMGNHGTGCFTPQMGVTKGELADKLGYCTEHHMASS